uniref:Uncharacterized protein n=1 Tax=viral metagenome TaxID=1070528 RepID=A0A6H1Z8R4_9ZZZZ
MPGPVSNSMPMPSDKALKEAWRDEWLVSLRQQGARYFVFKIKDAFEALSPAELDRLNKMLAKMEQYRMKRGTAANRRYWVFGRHWPGAEMFHQLMEFVFGHKVGEPW